MIEMMEKEKGIKQIEQRIEKRFRKALTDYQLIADGDHVLVALSGGKDSLLLLELLAKRSRIFKPRFKVSAVHVRMENIPYESDTRYLETFCRALDVELHVVTTSFSTLQSPLEGKAIGSQKRESSPCFLCSWNRRKQIFNLAQLLGCNKIALGHHQDDIIHTALMNTVFEGRFSSMPVVLRMKKMPLTMIRPLALQHEADIKAYAEARHYEKQKKLCPYEHETHRAGIARLFAQIEQTNPEARYSIWHALERDGKLTEL
ncbi:MAG: tRNA 2-thiocytidine biosynthesis protein TtcA [Prevotella sp.]|nr:tRNA 2-thiocytidine biosynthesis protein TtcA [Prevotella sp.]